MERMRARLPLVPRASRSMLAVGLLLVLLSGCRWDIEDLSQRSLTGDDDSSLAGTLSLGGGIPANPESGGASSNGGATGGDNGDGGSGSFSGAGGLVGAGSDCQPCSSGESCHEGSCQPVRRVFITQTAYRADFGSTANADALCQKSAGESSLGGTWRAWISDSTTSPMDTFVQDVGPYVLLDGTRIAADYADLTDGALQQPIDLDETGAHQKLQEVWTGTAIDGSYSGSTCNGWTTIAASHVATEGLSDDMGAGWTDVYLQFCDRAARLYCFEQ